MESRDIRSYFKTVKKEPIMMKLDDKSWIIKGHLPDGLYADNFEELWRLRPNSLAKIRIAGKLIDCPRWQQTYMSNYWFSGIVHEAVDLPGLFKPYLDWANSLGYGNYNLALANFYENGLHYIGSHSDDESQLVKGAAIVSVSLGDFSKKIRATRQERTFRIRNKETKAIVKDIELGDGTFVIMGGEMQEHYLHEVPKVTGKKGESMGRRINLTFRQTK